MNTNASVQRERVAGGSTPPALRLRLRERTNNDTGAEPESSRPLPTLRQELDLVKVGTSKSPQWTLHDPIRARYFRIGWLEFELLVRFKLGDPKRVIESVNRDTPLHASLDDINALVTLLETEELVQAQGRDGRQRLAEHTAGPTPSLMSRAFRLSMHARLSLLDPHRILLVLTRLATPILDRPRAMATCVLVLACLALFGLATHAFEFRDTLTSYLSPSGLAMFASTLIALNIIHEFGHGIIATRLGCRVHAMGVALIFMIPVAWCDTSDAWRLRTAKERLAIDAGGLAIEGVLAIIATLAWLVLPDGTLRALAFFVAATSLATSCLINLNPFMKFDGYFLLADYLGVENLQERAFDSLRQRLRRALYASDHALPPNTSGVSEQTLSWYAAATWVYRLFLYFTIAWAVYTFWFKALGIVLAAGVIATLIIRPIVRELLAFLTYHRRHGASRRSCLSLAFLLVCTLLYVLPLPTAVYAPAILLPAEQAQLFAPVAARVVKVHVVEGDYVSRGAPLVTLGDASLSHDIARLTRERAALIERRRGRVGERLTIVPASYRSDHATPSSRSDSWAESVSDEALAEHDAQIAQAEEQLRSLTLLAPFDATVMSVDESVISGRWVNSNTPLAELATPAQTRVHAYVPSFAANRIDLEDMSQFIPNDGSATIALTVASFEDRGVDQLVDAALAIPHGGPIPVRAAEDTSRTQSLASDARPLVPIQDLYPITFQPDADISLQRTITGYVRLPATPASLAARTFNRLYGTLVRESGF